MSEKLSRKIFSKAEWLAMFRDGLHGSPEAFARHLKKLSGRLVDADPDMAAAIRAELERGAVTRGVFQPNPVDADSRQKLLQETWPVVMPREPVWSPEVFGALARVVDEWKGAARLREAGMMPTRSVLLSGPPGVGKTLAASWLAMHLNVPLYTLDLATVMNSFLGKTGQNLRLVLSHAMTTKSVLLLDEFDAIAKRRDDDSDVGELKRLVNVLLQAVDNWSGESLLVAATNHPDLLDPAVWRRFDLSLAIGHPTQQMQERFLGELGINPPDVREIMRLVDGQSFANIERWIRSARKEELLHGARFMEAFVTAFSRDQSTRQLEGKASRDMRIWSLHVQGKSDREIAREIGCSHPTVGSVIRRMKGEHHG